MSKIVVITGAGGILCSEFAKDLASIGHKVALLDLNVDAAQTVADEITAAGGTAIAVKCNVLETESIEAAHKEVNQKLGLCDILINGAGGNSPKGTTSSEYFDVADVEDESKVSFFDLKPKDVGFVFDLNVIGTFLPTQAFAKDMIGHKGCILNISSMNAFRPLTKIPAYSAAKSGVSNFTQWLAVHFAMTGIRVNAIAPGFFVTKQNKDLLFDKDGNPTARTQKILNGTPMRRFGESKELLGAVRFLTDDTQSGFISGVVLPIDGGFSAYSGV